jgi:hypothetical protein
VIPHPLRILEGQSSQTLEGFQQSFSVLHILFNLTNHQYRNVGE